MKRQARINPASLHPGAGERDQFRPARRVAGQQRGEGSRRHRVGLEALGSQCRRRRDPSALVFGTDMPSTRAQRPFAPADLSLMRQVLGAELAQRATSGNARAAYRL